MGPPALPSLETWTPPQEFDEYRLVRPIGLGRTGRVYLAHDTLLERPVAVKFIPALGPHALARFLVEARAAARIQHPNVVTLYRVGQLEQQPYLVSEFIRGISLDRLARPVSWERALALGLGLARGLAAAHRRGVLHRDIKPGNAVLTESGEVKLLDFGLAKLLDTAAPGAVPDSPRRASCPSEAGEEEALGARSVEGMPLPSLPHGALVGTPHYMAPEAWAGEPLSARSDVYSLGVVLYELCAGQSPFRHVPLARLPEVVASQDAPPLAQVAPGVGSGLAAVVDRCLRREPQERYPSAPALLDALEQLRREEMPPHVPQGNPYRGLQAFEAEHRALFFGRRREQHEVLERLKAEAFLLVTGDSGVGKSSLCLAGVLPRVADGALEDGRRWHTARLVPGRRPTSALAAALAPVLRCDEESLADSLRADASGLARALRGALGAREGLLVFVDQLEELVTLAGPQEAACAGRVLGALAEGVSGVRLLATARGDFLTRLTAVPGLGAEVPRALCLLGALGPEETRQAVVGPARVQGVRFESEALVDTLVDAAASAPGGLPLLQFALAELWEARDARQGVVTQRALEGLGGVAGALARHADAALARLLPSQREAARGVLLRLVTAEGTRARRTAEELGAEDARHRAALEALVRARLLVAREVDGATAYELAHEALLSGWRTLARWLAEAAEHREVRGRLESAAAHWERVGRARDVLWSPRQLAEAAALDGGTLTRRERDFLEASRRTVVRGRRLRRALLLGFLASLGLVWGGVELRAGWRREAQVRTRLREASETLADARRARQALEAERAAALRLYDSGRRAEGDAAWREAEARGRALRERHGAVEGRLEQALALDPGRPEVRGALGDFLHERALLAELQGEAQVLPTLLRRLRLYDEGGERWRQWTQPARLTLEVDAPGARLELRPVTRQEDGSYRVGAPLAPGPAPWVDVALPPGHYQLSARAPGHASALLPLRLTRGECLRLVLPLPREGSLPKGFVYVPPGPVLFGSAAEASVREFFNAVPLHEAHTPGFLIARHETTYAQWLAFLEALPRGERERRTPSVGSAYRGLLALERVEGTWRLRFQPGSLPYVARAGEPVRYGQRARGQEQDWLRLPVTGVSFEDAEAYASWLRETGRVPGARLCTELEWERAARGADGREFPHGDVLAPEDANIDATYGKRPEGFGPDEVGSHPASRSPFGVEDMAGNVWEWTRSSLEPGRPVARGGSYYYAANSARSANRELPEPNLRDLTVGLRLCADAPGRLR